MDHVTPDPAVGRPAVRLDRRTVLVTGAVAGASAWVAPSIRSVASAQAATAAPGPVAGMAAWFDGALGVTAPGGFVTSWADQSPNGNDAIAPGGQEPTPAAGAINGLPAISFDGTGQHLQAPVDISPATSPDTTIFTVFLSDTADGNPLRKLYGADAGFDRVVGLDDRAGGFNYVYFSETPGFEVTGYFNLAATTAYLTVDQWSIGTFTGTVNGVVTINAAPVQIDGGATTLTIGAVAPSGAEPWLGLIAEMIIYTTALTAPEIAQTQQYLLDKYAL